MLSIQRLCTFICILYGYLAMYILYGVCLLSFYFYFVCDCLVDSFVIRLRIIWIVCCALKYIKSIHVFIVFVHIVCVRLSVDFVGASLFSLFLLPPHKIQCIYLICGGIEIFRLVFLYLLLLYTVSLLSPLPLQRYPRYTKSSIDWLFYMITRHTFVYCLTNYTRAFKLNMVVWTHYIHHYVECNTIRNEWQWNQKKHKTTRKQK